ncbi:MAG: RHS repeat-associated core domain-containing protein, partial [Pseudomonadales bacterium]|nr:RHS repeat-associated core domain-containing protein [Pseudomonadales bacterium]
RLLRTASDRREYDALGAEIRVVGKTTEHRQFDGEGQLIEVRRPGLRVTYGYDALGRRAWRKTEAGTTTYLWHGDVLLGEQSPQGQWQWYLRNPASDEPLVTLIDGEPCFYELDWRMMPIRLWSRAGEKLWQANANAWGQCQPDTPKGHIHQPIRLPGQFEDELTGIVQNRFREYEPATGRYLCADPYALKGGLNNFRYTPNPLDYIDRLGLACDFSLSVNGVPVDPESVAFDGTESPAAQALYQAGGFFKGVGLGAWEVVTGAVDMAAAGVKLSPASLMLETVSGGAYTGYSDTQNAIKEGAAAIYSNPGAVVDAAIKPYSDAIARGDYGEAVGRGTFELASMVFAPAKAAKVAKIAGKVEVPNKTGPDWVNLSDVKYTQKTVSIKSGDGTPVLDIAYQMKNNGWNLSKGAPDLIKLDDGFMTLDHRRLVAADWAGLDEIPANIHGFNEALPSSFTQSKRFQSFESPVDFSDISTQTTFYKGDLPETWGQAGMMRSLQQQEKFGQFPISGSTELPEFTFKGANDWAKYINQLQRLQSE